MLEKEEAETESNGNGSNNKNDGRRRTQYLITECLEEIPQW